MTDPVEDVRSKLAARPYAEWKACAADIDVKPITIKRFATGVTPSPTVHIFFAIRDWVRRNRRRVR